MKNTSRFSRFRVLPLLFAVVGTGSALAFVRYAPVANAQTQAAPAAVGVVDEDKLADGYKEYQNAIATLDKRAQDLDAKIPAREYLNETESKRFDALIVIPTLDSKQQAELDALVKTGLDRKVEFMALNGNANRTPAMVARLKELQEISAKNIGNVQVLAQNLLDAIRKQQDDTDKKYTDKAQSVVIQVAGEKKLSAVIRKKALVWSADNTDITDEVLKRLN